jgi:hypothetical protein
MMPGGQEAAMEEARLKTIAHRRRIRHWTHEKALGDDWIGKLETTPEIPGIAQINGVYLMSWYKDRPVVVRPPDATVAEIPYLDVDEQTAASQGQRTSEEALERWLTAAAKDRHGIRINGWYQHGCLTLAPSPTNQDVPPETRRYDLFLCATTSALDDLPEDAWARRTITRKDFVELIRTRHPEYVELIEQAHDGFLIRRAQEV